MDASIYVYEPSPCCKCGAMIETENERAGYAGPYRGRSLFKRLWYRGRWCSYTWHIRCRPEWANPWNFPGLNHW